MHGTMNIKFTIYICDNMSHNFFLNEKYFRQKGLKEIKASVLRSITFFQKLCLLWDVEIYARDGEATDDNVAHALWMLDNLGVQTHTQNM